MAIVRVRRKIKKKAKYPDALPGYSRFPYILLSRDIAPDEDGDDVWHPHGVTSVLTANEASEKKAIAHAKSIARMRRAYLKDGRPVVRLINIFTRRIVITL